MRMTHRLVLLTFLESCATIFVERGVYFYAHEQLGFGRHRAAQNGDRPRTRELPVCDQHALPAHRSPGPATLQPYQRVYTGDDPGALDSTPSDSKPHPTG